MVFIRLHQILRRDTAEIRKFAVYFDFIKKTYSHVNPNFTSIIPRLVKVNKKGHFNIFKL